MGSPRCQTSLRGVTSRHTSRAGLNEQSQDCWFTRFQTPCRLSITNRGIDKEPTPIILRRLSGNWP